MTGRLCFARVGAAAAAALLAGIASAGEADRTCTRAGIDRVPALTALQTVEQIFDEVAARAASAEPQTEPTTMEVVVARLVDGKVVMVCVDTKEAARRFLTAPAERLAGRPAQEE